MSAQLCLTLSDVMDCSPPGSSIHGILHARIPEWVAISFSRGSSQPRDRTRVACVSCIGRGLVHHWATWEASQVYMHVHKHILFNRINAYWPHLMHWVFFPCKPNLAWLCLQVFWERNRQELQELISMPEERCKQASWIWLPDPGGSTLPSSPPSL